MKKYLFCISLLWLAGCVRTNDDLAPWAGCQNLNLNFGVAAYEQCVEQEEWRLSDEVQEEEFKRMNIYRHDVQAANYQ